MLAQESLFVQQNPIPPAPPAPQSIPWGTWMARHLGKLRDGESKALDQTGHLLLKLPAGSQARRRAHIRDSCPQANYYTFEPAGPWGIPPQLLLLCLAIRPEPQLICSAARPGPGVWISGSREGLRAGTRLWAQWTEHQTVCCLLIGAPGTSWGGCWAPGLTSGGKCSQRLISIPAAARKRNAAMHSITT